MPLALSMLAGIAIAAIAAGAIIAFPHSLDPFGVGTARGGFRELKKYIVSLAVLVFYLGSTGCTTRLKPQELKAHQIEIDIHALDRTPYGSTLDKIGGTFTNNSGETFRHVELTILIYNDRNELVREKTVSLPVDSYPGKTVHIESYTYSTGGRLPPRCELIEVTYQ